VFHYLGLPRWLSGKEFAYQCGRHRRYEFDPWGQEDPLEKGMATHSTSLAWKIPWTEEPGGLQSMWSQKVRHNWVTEYTYISLFKSFHMLFNSTWLFAVLFLFPWPSAHILEDKCWRAFQARWKYENICIIYIYIYMYLHLHHYSCLYIICLYIYYIKK